MAGLTDPTRVPVSAGRAALCRGGLGRDGRDRGGFTLIELLVVLAIVALLIGLLMPAMGQARALARTTKCLTQVRSLAVAHTAYMQDYRERFIDAALAHGGLGDPRSAWPVTLAEYAGGSLILRSPVDRSPQWPVADGGQNGNLGYAEFMSRFNNGRAASIPSNLRVSRWTSYGLNNYLTRSKAPPRELLTNKAGYSQLKDVPRPAATVHFVMMTQGLDGSPFALSDHVHAESWSDGGEEFAPVAAAEHMDLAAHGGSKGWSGEALTPSWDGLSNYGFLDGHAATLRFRDVYTSFTRNRFDPSVAF
jgi:prepilin-type N-terminal cleavage/methylation domain-containing protein/prepilin-type processing-associated H-X9-DG protein